VKDSVLSEQIERVLRIHFGQLDEGLEDQVVLR
jgi:hypothetical protein